jgi:hypothetical protein
VQSCLEYQGVPAAGVLQGDEALLGAVDTVEAGEVWGWACLRGAPAEALQVDGFPELRLTPLEGTLRIL